MNPVGKPDAGKRHVRFDERGEETERCRMAQATAPLLDSTRSCGLQVDKSNKDFVERAGTHKRL